jgi:hypothetical protein
MEQVLQKLTSLRLNVIHELDEAAPETEIEVCFYNTMLHRSLHSLLPQKPEPHEFFTRILPSIWLKPAMGSLENLSLYSTFYWGAYPRVNLDGVHFPRLKSLSLGHFSFVDDKQLDWILEHSSTLEELYLDDCPIMIALRLLSESDLSNCQIPKDDLEQKVEDHMSQFRYTYPRR